MKYTRFFDRASGGSEKLGYANIIIAGDEESATEAFEKKFKRTPDHVTCDCCGQDFYVTEYDSREDALKHCDDRTQIIDQP